MWNFHNIYCPLLDTNNLFLPLSNLKSPPCLAWDSNPPTVQTLALETVMIPLDHKDSCIFLFNCRVIRNPLSYSFKSHLAKLSQLLLSHCLRYKTIISSTLNHKIQGSLVWESNPHTVQALAVESAVILLHHWPSCITLVNL